MLFVDILNTRRNAKSDKCSGGLWTSRYSLVFSEETYTRFMGGLSPLANDRDIIFSKFKEKINSQNINVRFQDDTPLPFDEAA